METLCNFFIALPDFYFDYMDFSGETVQLVYFHKFDHLLDIKKYYLVSSPFVIVKL